MLPIGKASKFKRVLEKGGHNKPWSIEVLLEDNQLVTAVLKIYKTDQIYWDNSVTAEIIGNILAQEFDFVVPQALLVETTGNFYKSLSADLQLILDLSDTRVKFASIYIDNTTKLQTGLPLEKLSEIDFETLYAFDNLIRNSDRGTYKTNMLLHNETEEVYLIDHELALNIDKNTIHKLTPEDWEKKFTKYHFAYEYLREKGNNDFYEFREYFRTLDFEVLNLYFEQLEDLGFDTKQNEILSYFSYIKNNENKFLNILKASLE